MPFAKATDTALGGQTAQMVALRMVCVSVRVVACVTRLAVRRETGLPLPSRGLCGGNPLTGETRPPA